mgnify:CR=1 FL=1
MPARIIFSDGITEDVITALGRFSNLLVVAKSASFQFKGRNLSPAEIGRLLDARYLLEGSVRRAGDRVRVNVELTEAATGAPRLVRSLRRRARRTFSPCRTTSPGVLSALAAVKLTRFRAGARPRQAHRQPRRLRIRPARP